MTEEKLEGVNEVEVTEETSVVEENAAEEAAEVVVDEAVVEATEAPAKRQRGGRKKRGIPSRLRGRRQRDFLRR